VDWLAARERTIFFALDGHPAGAVARALAVALLVVSRRGLVWWVLLACAFVFGGRRARRVAVTAAVALALAGLLSWGVEGLFQREVPALAYGSGVFSLARFQPRFSFPEARAALAFAALPFLGRGRGGAALILWVLGVLTALAGIWAGAYYPTDALAGAALGWVGARLAVWLLGSPFRRPPGHLVPWTGAEASPVAAAAEEAGGRRRHRRLRGRRPGAGPRPARPPGPGPRPGPTGPRGRRPRR
jgi:membrane-associated phospholipid phosphatase